MFLTSPGNRRKGSVMAGNLLSLFDEVDRQVTSNPQCTLRKLCRVLHVDRHAIEKSVHEAKRLNFRDLKNSRLLEKSVAFLRSNPGTTIKHTALTLGFRRPRDFSRFIKNCTGKTPAEI